jgi:hypothetical protein
MPPSNDPPFYASCRTYRNLRTILAIVVAALFATFPTMAMIRGIPGQGRSGPAYLFACFFSLLFVFLVFLGFKNFITNRKDYVQLGPAGVTLANRLLPWSEIIFLSFSRTSFSQSGWISVSTHPQGVVSVPLKGQRALTPAELQVILERLTPWLEQNHPKVQIRMLT